MGIMIETWNPGSHHYNDDYKEDSRMMDLVIGAVMTGLISLFITRIIFGGTPHNYIYKYHCSRKNDES